MVRVLFFARLREQLGESQLELPLAEAGANVGELLAGLRQRGERWDEALSATNLLCAVNQVQAAPAQTLAEGDEVAFYPPVTGG